MDRLERLHKVGKFDDLIVEPKGYKLELKVNGDTGGEVVEFPILSHVYPFGYNYIWSKCGLDESIMQHGIRMESRTAWLMLVNALIHITANPSEYLTPEGKDTVKDLVINYRQAVYFIGQLTDACRKYPKAILEVKRG